MDEKIVKDSQCLVKDLVNDTISRRAAIVAVCKSECGIGFCGVPCREVDALKALSSAQPKRTEERTETHACDLIDRAEAIDALRTHERKPSKKWFDNQLDIEWNNAIDICCYDIEDLPSAQPGRKKGKWIYGEDEYGIDGYHCDKCGFFVPWDYAHKFINYIEDYNFCPNCGADMRKVDDGQV